MQVKRSFTVAALLLLVVLALAGCAPRPGAGEAAAKAPADALVVDLPAIAIDFDANGAASIGGIPIADVAASFGVPAELPITAENIAMLTGLGIQHIQLVNLPSGLGIYVNGKQIPSLGWTSETLQQAADTLAGQSALGKLLPIVTQLGVGVTLRFPVAADAKVAPLIVPAAETGAAQLAASQKTFVEGVGSKPVIAIPIKYNLDGSWTAGGFPSETFAATPVGPFLSALNLTPSQIQRDIKAGIKTIQLKLNENGVAIVWNGTELPSLDWSGGKLASVVSLLQDTGVLKNVPGLDPATLQTVLDNALPILTSSDVSLELIFPTQ